MNTTDKNLRFRVACRMLRNAGHLDAAKALPGQKRGESHIDFLVRQGLAKDKYLAAEMLIIGRGLERALNETLAIANIADIVAPPPDRELNRSTMNLRDRLPGKT